MDRMPFVCEECGAVLADDEKIVLVDLSCEEGFEDKAMCLPCFITGVQDGDLIDACTCVEFFDKDEWESLEKIVYDPQ